MHIDFRLFLKGNAKPQSVPFSFADERHTQRIRHYGPIMVLKNLRNPPHLAEQAWDSSHACFLSLLQDCLKITVLDGRRCLQYPKENGDKNNPNCPE